MQIAISKYLKPQADVDVIRPAHIEFINQLKATHQLIMSGRQQPAEGGVIIAIMKSIEEFKTFMANDPYVKAGVAEYKIIEFVPSNYHACVEQLIK